MPYTLEELAPILAVLNAGSENFQKMPPAKKTKLIAKITPQEMQGLQFAAQDLANYMLVRGETVETVTATLKLSETMFGYMERSMTLAEIAKLVPAEGLGAKDVQILHDLGLPKSAQVIDYALTPPAPPKPEECWGLRPDWPGNTPKP